MGKKLYGVILNAIMICNIMVSTHSNISANNINISEDSSSESEGNNNIPTKSRMLCSYNMIDYNISNIGYKKYNEYPQQDNIIGYIKDDKMDLLKEELSKLKLPDKNIYIRPDQIKDSDIYKCILCKHYEYIEPISLIEYAFSCGSKKCVEFLLPTHVKYFNLEDNALMFAAIISCDPELIKVAEGLEQIVDIRCLYALMKMAYTGNEDKLKNRDCIFKWILNNNFINDLKEDEAETAIVFLLMEENKHSSNNNDAVLKIYRSSFGLKKMIEFLLNSCVKNNSFSINLASFILVAPGYNSPLYNLIKDKFQKYYISNAPLDISKIFCNFSEDIQKLNKVREFFACQDKIKKSL